METVGAMIEHGVITAVSNGAYRVKSLDRPGIETKPIKPIIAENGFIVGDKVYFFVFGTGDGAIIAEMTEA